MVGPKQEAQAALFYEFSLDDHIPMDHLFRSMNRFVDLSSIRAHLADLYSHTGRPSVDPELPILMLLIGYCFGIRSERRLCEEVHLNLAYRWFCRLDLSDRVADQVAVGVIGQDLVRHEVANWPRARAFAVGEELDQHPYFSEANKRAGARTENWTVR